MQMKPILFNTEMVRAILDGRKTVTRRIIKPQPKSEVVFHLGIWQETQMCANGLRVLTPPFKVGDVLYVRETWGQTADLPGISEEATVYAADFTDRELAHLKDKHFRWRPSIHMPKELARLFLKVTAVRVERLHNMRLADALAEGIIAEVGATWEKWCNLWNSTIPKEELAACGWKANPWVWVIQFEVCEKPEAK